MIYRIDPDLALRQGLWIVVGLAVFAACALFIRDYRALDGVKYIARAVARSSCSSCRRVPRLGATINGASLWVRVGPIAFQPGELAKVLLVVFLAGYLRDRREVLASGLGRFGLPSLKHAGPLLLIWGGAMLVLFQTNDLGGGLLYFAVFLAMLYVATGRWAYVAVGIALFALGAVGLYHVVSARRGARDDLARPVEPIRQTPGYQLVQSIYAIAGGGVFGAGLGRGVLVTPGGRHRTSPTSRPISSTRPSRRSSGWQARRP